MTSVLMNFCRTILAAGKLFSRFAFVNDLGQSTGRIAQTLGFAPIRLPFVAAAHESNVARVSCHERQSACKG